MSHGEVAQQLWQQWETDSRRKAGKASAAGSPWNTSCVSLARCNPSTRSRATAPSHFDGVTQTVEREAWTMALHGSTEDEQFFDSKFAKKKASASTYLYHTSRLSYQRPAPIKSHGQHIHKCRRSHECHTFLLNRCQKAGGARLMAIAWNSWMGRE
jgi:hypothetical protein